MQELRKSQQTLSAPLLLWAELRQNIYQHPEEHCAPGGLQMVASGGGCVDPQLGSAVSALHSIPEEHCLPQKVLFSLLEVTQMQTEIEKIN